MPLGAEAHAQTEIPPLRPALASAKLPEREIPTVTGGVGLRIQRVRVRADCVTGRSDTDARVGKERALRGRSGGSAQGLLFLYDKAGVFAHAVLARAKNL